MHHDEPWSLAQRSAPWRRYTSLTLPSVEPYFKAARLDWWGLLWILDAPQSAPLGVAFLVGFLALSLSGSWWWRRLLDDEADPGA